MKERKKCKKMSPHWLQCAKWFSRYLIPKSGIWAKWKSPFWRFWASFSHKYDVTDAILQDNEKVKALYLRSLLLDLFEILQAVRSWQRIFTWFQISLLWQPKSAQSSIIEETKGPLFKQKCFQKNIWNNTIKLLPHVVSFLKKKLRNTFLIVRKQESFVFEQRLITLIVNAKARKLEIKQNSFAKF